MLPNPISDIRGCSWKGKFHLTFNPKKSWCFTPRILSSKKKQNIYIKSLSHQLNITKLNNWLPLEACYLVPEPTITPGVAEPRVSKVCRGWWTCSPILTDDISVISRPVFKVSVLNQQTPRHSGQGDREVKDGESCWNTWKCVSKCMNQPQSKWKPWLWSYTMILAQYLRSKHLHLYTSYSIHEMALSLSVSLPLSVWCIYIYIYTYIYILYV